MIAGLQSTAVVPVAQMSTTSSGLPAVSVDFTSSPNVGLYDRWDPPSPYNGASLDAEFVQGTLEVVRAAPGERVGWDVVFPSPQRVFFTIIDMEYPEESAAIVGFDGATTVSPQVIRRAAPGDPGVDVSGVQPDGSVVVRGAFGAASDFDAGVTVDVVFEQPVDRIHVEQFNPGTIGGTTFVEYTAPYGCQGLDVVETSSGPVEIAGAVGRRVFLVPLHITVGNTAAGGDMRVDAAQVTNDLSTLLTPAGGPAGTLDGIDSVEVQGPAAACQPNAAYDGVVDTRLLAGTGWLEPGQACTIDLTARVSFPTFADAVAVTNQAVATSAGTTNDTSTSSSSLPAAIHADSPSPTAIIYPAPEASTTTSTTTTTATTTAPPPTPTPIAVDPSIGATSSTPAPVPAGALPATGSPDTTPTIVAATTLVLLGGCLVGVRRRRRSPH